MFLVELPQTFLQASFHSIISVFGLFEVEVRSSVFQPLKFTLSNSQSKVQNLFDPFQTKS